MNPKFLLQASERLKLFQSEHPKVLPFLQAVRSEVLEEGSIIELKVTAPDGKSLESNIRATKNDLETIRLLLDGK